MRGAGYDEAAAWLEPREFPESLGYLYDWFRELERAREFSELGPEGFTYQMIADWARLMGRSPDPLDVEGLLALDMVSRFPDAGKEDEPVEVKPPRAWPSKKGGTT